MLLNMNAFTLEMPVYKNPVFHVEKTDQYTIETTRKRFQNSVVGKEYLFFINASSYLDNRLFSEVFKKKNSLWKRGYFRRGYCIFFRLSIIFAKLRNFSSFLQCSLYMYK